MTPFLLKRILAPLAPFVRYWSTPERAEKIIAGVVSNAQGVTGTCFDERGLPMRGSSEVSDSEFQDRVGAETRAFLAAHPDQGV